MSNKGGVDPGVLRECLAVLHSEFQKQKMADASECYGKLIDFLHTSLLTEGEHCCMRTISLPF